VMLTASFGPCHGECHDCIVVLATRSPVVQQPGRQPLA
jgi:hypothetical protein